MIFRTGSIKLTIDNIIAPSRVSLMTSRAQAKWRLVKTTEMDKTETESDVLVSKRKAKAFL